MGEARYDLVFEGEFVEGFDPQQVRARFAEVFKLSEEKLERVFSSTRVVLRRKLNQEHAQRFRDFLVKIGMQVHVLALPAESAGAIASPAAPPPMRAVPMDEAPTAPEPHALRFEFHGRGAEYFRIWIVNLFLTIITLGIYSAWAKVRNNQYFYGNTRLDGSSFAYLASPITILKGRLIAMGLFVIYLIAEAVQPLLAAALALAFVIALPWIMVKSLIFNARNSAYRNVRFDFAGTTGQAVAAFIGWPLLGMLTLGLLFPYAYYKQQRFIIANSAYGDQRFGFETQPKQYYMTFLATLGFVLVGIAAVIAVVFAAAAVAAPQVISAVLAPFGMMLVYLLAGAYLYVHLTNLRFNGAVLAEHRFRSHLSVWSYAWIWSSNAIAMLLTVGLYYPWARVRIARYRAQCLDLLPSGDLDKFAAARQQKVSAIGQEIGDVFDVGMGI